MEIQVKRASVKKTARDDPKDAALTASIVRDAQGACGVAYARRQGCMRRACLAASASPIG